MPRTRSRLFGLAMMALIALVGWIDYASGSRWSVAPLYLLPILWIAWRHGRTGALVMSAFAALTWFTADIAVQADGMASIWNASTRFVMFGAVGWSVAQLRSSERLLRHTNARLQVLLDREANLASTDPLTGLLNRRGFAQHCRIELARARRAQTATGLIYIDLDKFKTINDHYGHAAGDKVLERVGAEIRASVRETDICGRIGGDEFAVFCWNPTQELLHQAATRLSERIRALAIEGPDSGFGASAGVVWFETPPDDLEQFLQLADAEMYRVKKAKAAHQKKRARRATADQPAVR